MASIYFEKNSWKELEEIIRKDPVVLFPYGTIEEHGPHLPVSTDFTIAQRIGEGVAKKLDEENIPVLLLPSVWTGYSSKVMHKWPGTISLKPEIVKNIIYYVCSSLIEMGLKKIIIIDCHGHHSGIMNVAARELADAYGIGIVISSPATLSSEAYNKIRKSKQGGSIHAGEWETSLMLYFGENVDMSKATNIDIMKYSSEFIPGDNFSGSKKVWWSTWAIQQSKTGVYGDPTVACKETGEIIYKAAIKNYVKFIKEFNKFHLRNLEDDN